MCIRDSFRAQLELDDEGYFRSGEDCRTRLPGVFVAGDCRAKEVRQLATAAVSYTHLDVYKRQ